MLKKHIVCYATRKEDHPFMDFGASQETLLKEAKIHGFVPHKYTKKDVWSTEFYKENSKILDCGRGNGYWLWKPYVINEVFNKADYGDVIFYIDSGKGWGIIDPNAIIRICRENDGFCFPIECHDNKKFTKRDCFHFMNCDYPKFHDAKQCHAGYQFYIKNEKTKFFIKEWLDFCKNENIITDIPNVCGKDNFPEFFDHRHDQSVLSNLRIKHKVKGTNIGSIDFLGRKYEKFKERFKYAP